MSSKQATEQGSRVEDAQRVKLDVRSVLTAHKASDRRVAETIDIAPSLLSRRLDPDEKNAHLQFVDVQRMDAEVQLDIIRKWAARLGCDVVPSGQAMNAASGVLAAASVLSAAAEAATGTIIASADGRLDRAEAAPLRATYVQVRDHANTMIRTCDTAMREGVTPLASMNAKGGDA